MSASRTSAIRNSPQIVEFAIKYNKPVRIGANWGSLDQELLTRLMDENSKSAEPRDAREVMHEAMVQSAMLSAAARRRNRPAEEPHHPVGESFGGAGL